MADTRCMLTKREVSKSLPTLTGLARAIDALEERRAESIASALDIRRSAIADESKRVTADWKMADARRDAAAAGELRALYGALENARDAAVDAENARV